MKFGYGEAFRASRATGYEVMLYACSHGDATLFSRGDLVDRGVEQVAQPILDRWAATRAGLPRTTSAARGARSRRPI